MARNNNSNSVSHQEQRLDRIVSEKTGIQQAVGKPILSTENLQQQAEANAAQQQQREQQERQIKRYQVASMAYLGAILKDTDAVSEVWGRILEKWLSGKFSNYDRSLSFRRYLKKILSNEAKGYWAELAKHNQHGVVRMPSQYEHEDALDETGSEAFDRKLQDSVIERALEDVRQEDSLYHETLKVLMRASASGAKPKSDELASHLSEFGNTRISRDHARKIKERAREMLSRKIVEQVGLFINSEDLEKIEVAVTDWGLLPYCQKALAKLRGT